MGEGKRVLDRSGQEPISAALPVGATRQSVTRRKSLAILSSVALLPASSAALARTKSVSGGRQAYDVAIVGAGVFGAWAAWHLARSGRKVALIDQYGAGHARSSSGGESRVIRISYGGDPIYSPMALDSLRQWQLLSTRSALPLFHQTGVLWFSPAGSDYVRKSLEWLRANKRGFSNGNTAWLKKKFPQIEFNVGEEGFLELETGGLIAGRAVQSVIADARLQLVNQAASQPQKLSDGSYQVASDIHARNVVYACGPWLPKLFPDILTRKIVPTRQEVFHFGAAVGDTRFAAPALPVWADFNAGEIVYGLPDIEGQGFKLAFDKHGAEVDPDRLDRQISKDGYERARAYVSARFPALANAPLIHSRVCQYENSSNGDFLIDRLPGHDRVWLVGAGSGHGFKHGPAVGARVARHVTDAAYQVEPRFALAAKGVAAARSVY
jgi:sarcosine oxidase